LYVDGYSKEIARKLAKLRKKNLKDYQTVRKKMDWILAHPEHKYKDLHYDMKGVKRVHIGHFVLTFIINHIKKIISFEDYEHHDKVYKK
jgi:mRNA-degrading endonuclease RelE of RelBE toxin-antitoxin system